MSAEAKINELGLNLSQATPPVANYVPAVVTGKLVFLSGVLPYADDGSRMAGKVSVAYSIDEAQKAARQTMTGLLARLRAEIGSLDRVTRIVKELQLEG